MFQAKKGSEERGCQMAIRSVTTQKAELLTLGSLGAEIEKPQESGASGNSGQEAKPQKIFAVLLNPSCEHDWFKLADELQTLESEGKTIWHCRTCAKVSSTYDWQTPSD
jgi:hypothetical protein